jgi:hypothetical protein
MPEQEACFAPVSARKDFRAEKHGPKFRFFPISTRFRKLLSQSPYMVTLARPDLAVDQGMATIFAQYAPNHILAVSRMLISI